jgi:hypothetical protein
LVLYEEFALLPSFAGAAIYFKETSSIGRELRIQLTLLPGQPLVPADEVSPRRTLSAPYQGGGKLQAICRPQGIVIQQVCRQISNLVAREDFPAGAA